MAFAPWISGVMEQYSSSKIREVPKCLKLILYTGVELIPVKTLIMSQNYSVLELVAANNNGIHSPSKMASQREGTDCSRPGQSLDFQVPPVQLWGLHSPICDSRNLLLLWHPKSLSLSGTCSSGGCVFPSVSHIRQEEGKSKGKFVSLSAETRVWPS